MSPLGRLAPGYRQALLLAALTCTAAALIGELRFGSSLYLYTDLKDKPGAFQGSMTVLSAFLLVVAGTLSLRAHEALRRRSDPAARSFLGAAALLAFLAFDELAMFHEWAADKLDRLQVPKPFGIDQDVYVFAGYGLTALLLLRRIAPVLWRHRAPWPLVLAMVAFAVGSEAVDFVPWDALSARQQAWLGPLEEGLKTMATFSAVLAVHALLDAIERGETPDRAP